MRATQPGRSASPSPTLSAHGQPWPARCCGRSTRGSPPSTSSPGAPPTTLSSAFRRRCGACGTAYRPCHHSSRWPRRSRTLDAVQYRCGATPCCDCLTASRSRLASATLQPLACAASPPSRQHTTSCSTSSPSSTPQHSACSCLVGQQPMPSWIYSAHATSSQPCWQPSQLAGLTQRGPTSAA